MPRKKGPFFPLQTDFMLKDKLCQRKAIQVCPGTFVVIGFKVVFIPVFVLFGKESPHSSPREEQIPDCGGSKIEPTLGSVEVFH